MKILVVDDHPLILDAVHHVLPQLEPSIEVLTAVDPGQAVAVLDDEPDVALVLLDLALPGARGLDVLADLLLDYPGVPVVVLSATHDDATVNAAMAAGARGFIPKTADASLLLDAIRRVVAGARTMPGPERPLSSSDAMRIAPRELGLTPRQADVLRLLVQGKPNKTICRVLQLSEGTVKVHVSAILKALRVQTRTQAVAELARRGINVDAIASH
jgi:DNA-binding NarL/FixJ family response regulator